MLFRSKPLIVWLHGIGERGTDMNIPLLSNDVYALTQPDIQGHFLTTGDQARGVNVLAVQTQTPWGSDNAAQLKETIDTYLANHPEVDKGRIYLAGVSNGGGMVLTMGATYPDYFAALVPIAAPLTVDQSGIDKLKKRQGCVPPDGPHQPALPAWIFPAFSGGQQAYLSGRSVLSVLLRSFSFQRPAAKALST